MCARLCEPGLLPESALPEGPRHCWQVLACRRSWEGLRRRPEQPHDPDEVPFSDRTQTQSQHTPPSAPPTGGLCLCLPEKQQIAPRRRRTQQETGGPGSVGRADQDAQGRGALRPCARRHGSVRPCAPGHARDVRVGGRVRAVCTCAHSYMPVFACALTHAHACARMHMPHHALTARPGRAWGAGVQGPPAAAHPPGRPSRCICSR